MIKIVGKIRSRRKLTSKNVSLRKEDPELASESSGGVGALMGRARSPLVAEDLGLQPGTCSIKSSEDSCPYLCYKPTTSSLKASVH